MHAHVPQIFPITTAIKPTLPSRVPSRPLVPLRLSLPLPTLSLSLCLFSSLPHLPSPFSIATLRNVFYAPARSYTHAYNVPTPRTVAQELLDRRGSFFRSLLPVHPIPSLFFPRARSLSLFPVPPPPFSTFQTVPRFQRGPARASGPRDLFSRAPVQGVTTLDRSIFVSNFPLDFPTSSRHRQLGRLSHLPSV